MDQTRMSVLRREFYADEGSFTLQLRSYGRWDRDAFADLIQAMIAICKAMEQATYLPRWQANVFWYTPDFARAETGHSNWRAKLEQDALYYRWSFSLLDILSAWLFLGELNLDTYAHWRREKQEVQVKSDYMEVLLDEFAGNVDAFLVQLLQHNRWDRHAFSRMAAAMLAYCKDHATAKEEAPLLRWLACGFWNAPRQTRRWVTEQAIGVDATTRSYYERALICLEELAFWLFEGESPVLNPDQDFIPI